MTEINAEEHATLLLQELGLTEYEAKTFIALSMVPQATAKEISELVDIPRTRVYDSVGILEEKGLVEIQHASPQLFRAVDEAEAISILRNEYEAHMSDLHRVLKEFDEVSPSQLHDTHEVWAFSGTEAIRERIRRLLANANEHVGLVVDDGLVDDAALLADVADAAERIAAFDVAVLDEESVQAVASAVPGARVGVLDLEWFHLADPIAPDTTIRFVLIVDHRAILASTRVGLDGDRTDRAVYAAGANNCLVTMIRRMLAGAVRQPAGI